ncbi:hypothetical protein H7K13_23790 [Priestia aryabhattai]|uniref:hypothetical protein n=1 Tax=Priestia aryabhattai TaxID=412384 RepID=UPI001C8D3141|nr:hypothetical protein [Priestia aryabhattai]MBY0077952.1 hypothetical protein [Priestia aryabhattai]
MSKDNLKLSMQLPSFNFSKMFQSKSKKGTAPSTQSLIDIRGIRDGKVITTDNRVVQILKVSSINLDLMSEYELKNIFDRFEKLLKSMNFSSQIEIVPQPMTLNKYLAEQQEIHDKLTNPFAKKLQAQYIAYTKSLETKKSIMQRKRYFIFDQKLKGPTEEDYYRTLDALEDKENLIASSLKELELYSERIRDAEINQLFYTLFDYQSALKGPILQDKIPTVVKGKGERKYA